jgi:hypothetical protein
MKNSIENTLKIIVAITGIICAIAACIAINGYLSGNDISASSSNSQTNPPAVPTAPLISTPAAAPAPTQQSTDTTPTPDSNDSGNSVSFSTPTPPPTPTPITAIDLPFGVTATNTITPATTSHLYKVVLPQAGRLTLNMTRSGNIELPRCHINLLDSR